MKARENSLFPLVHDYLKIYLPKQRNVSPNTIRSYRKALEELLDYVKDRKQISLGEVTFEHLTTDMILSFLEYLEVEKSCSIPTCNTRFAAIRAFMDYAADRDLTLVANLNKLKKVPFKKPGITVAVDYMRVAAITAVIEQPDTSTPKGLRDQFFMILLYDTGARVQEILNIKLCDLQLGRLPKVTLFGKGRKTRIVPLMEKTVLHLKKYLLVFHSDTVSATDLPLLYSVTHGEKHPLTPRMAQYILQKYGEQARCICQEVPEKVHPHLFRHTFSVLALQNGVDIKTLSSMLGHYSAGFTLDTYAHVTTAMQTKAANTVSNFLSSAIRSFLILSPYGSKSGSGKPQRKQAPPKVTKIR